MGIDGLILPDLPEFEYEKNYKAIIERNKLDFIFLVTPETSEERVKKLDELSSGFLYAVSSSSTTGLSKNKNDITQYLQKLKSLKLKNPILAGFGIGDKERFEKVCVHARGAIIGSAYIKALENVEDVNAATRTFLSSILPVQRKQME